MKAGVVILNYNTKDYLRQFLPGLLASCEGLDAGVYVADNASEDGSQEYLQSHFPQVPVIQLEKNFGFTGGYNRALKMIEADYYLLINSDIEVPEGWLRPLLEWMDTHPQCGACGPKFLSWHQRDTFEYAGAAGGLGGALHACLGAELVSGIDTVMNLIGFDKEILDAEYIITGEGSSDLQTLSGKVPMGVLKRSREVPVYLLSGRIRNREELLSAGFAGMIQVTPEDMPTAEAIKSDIARENLRLAAERFSREILG